MARALGDLVARSERNPTCEVQGSSSVLCPEQRQHRIIRRPRPNDIFARAGNFPISKSPHGRVSTPLPCSSRGVFRRRSLNAERGVASCGTARNRAPGGPGHRPPGTIRPGCEELAARAAEEMLQTEARPPAENRHGGAPRGERPTSLARSRASYDALWDARRLARAWHVAS